MNQTPSQPAPRQTPQGDPPRPGEPASPTITTLPRPAPAQRSAAPDQVTTCTTTTTGSSKGVSTGSSGSTAARTSTGASAGTTARARTGSTSGGTRKGRSTQIGQAGRSGQGGRGDYLAAARRLQSRDQVVITLLDEHHTLSTAQIAAILFGSEATARNRLYRLRQAGWVDCFTPIRGGRPLPTHWVPGPLGARWAASNDHRTPLTPRALRERNEATAASTHLNHTDGQHQFFIDLITTARTPHGRTSGRGRLARWWGPARTAAAYGQRVKPDGHGVWEHHDPATGRSWQVGWNLEHDTGTETLTRLAAKIGPYEQLRQAGGPDYPVLIWLPGPARETNLHDVLARTGIPAGLTIATTTRDVTSEHRDGPAGPVWKIAGNGRRRHRLRDLPSHPGTGGAFHPGPPEREDDPLYLLTAGKTATPG